MAPESESSDVESSRSSSAIELGVVGIPAAMEGIHVAFDLGPLDPYVGSTVDAILVVSLCVALVLLLVAEGNSRYRRAYSRAVVLISQMGFAVGAAWAFGHPIGHWIQGNGEEPLPAAAAQFGVLVVTILALYEFGALSFSDADLARWLRVIAVVGTFGLISSGLVDWLGPSHDRIPIAVSRTALLYGLAVVAHELLVRHPAEIPRLAAASGLVLGFGGLLLPLISRGLHPESPLSPLVASAGAAVGAALIARVCILLWRMPRRWMHTVFLLVVVGPVVTVAVRAFGQYTEYIVPVAAVLIRLLEILTVVVGGVQITRAAIRRFSPRMKDPDPRVSDHAES